LESNIRGTSLLGILSPKSGRRRWKANSGYNVSGKSFVVQIVCAYEVDRTLDGFRLILFLVRASGTGILCQREVKWRRNGTGGAGLRRAMRTTPRCQMQ
jgi:hypothetical protein